MTFNGKIIIGGITCTYELKDYTLIVMSETDKFLGWNTLRSILDDNDWICLTDDDENTLQLKIDNIDWLGKRKYCYKVAGYIITYSRYNQTIKKQEVQPFSFEHVVIRNDILDYFFKHDKTYTQSAAMLLHTWDIEQEEDIPSCNRPSYSILINELEYTLKFHVMIEGADTPFPYRINNAMDISGKLSNSAEELWNIVKTMRQFLKFISQSPSVNFDTDIRVYCGNDINNASTCLYLRPEKEYTIYPKRILEYSHLKNGVGDLINLIGSNKIYFRSLFGVDADYITYSDIMNVCAAFESQYFSLYCDFKDTKQSTIKRKMIKFITNNVDSFTEDELPYYNDILTGFRNFRDSLKQRLENALSEFEEIYGDEYIKYDFEMNYQDMPTRIKDARNALDHGNLNHTLNYNTYWDSELLRAITYMLILKQTHLSKKDIKSCLRKLSKFAV